MGDDVSIRVGVEGGGEAKAAVNQIGYSFDQLEKNSAKLRNELVDLNALLKLPIKTTEDLDKALQHLYEAQKAGTLSFVESEKRAQALGQQFQSLVPGAVGASNGIKDLGKALADTAVNAAGLGQQAQMVGVFGEALSGVGRISTRAAIAIAGVGVAVVGIAAIIGSKLVDAVSTVRALGDQFNNLSQQTGIAVEKLSGGLRLAAETSGSSVEALSRSIVLFNRNISEAQDGTGKTFDAFKRLGISLDDLKTKSPEELLHKVADAFKKAQDGITKTEIATALGGRTFAQLIPLLNKGSDGLIELDRVAKAAGITIDKETAEAASKLNENMRVLSAFGEGFWIGVASPIVDGMVKITKAMRDARMEGEGWLASLQAGAAKAAQIAFGVADPEQERAGVLAQLGRVDREIAEKRTRLSALNAGVLSPREGQFGGFMSGVESTPERQRQALEREIADREKQAQVLRDQRNKLNDILAIGGRMGEEGGKTTLLPPTPKPEKLGRVAREETLEQVFRRQEGFLKNEIKLETEGAEDALKEFYANWLQLAEGNLTLQQQVRVHAREFETKQNADAMREVLLRYKTWEDSEYAKGQVVLRTQAIERQAAEEARRDRLEVIRSEFTERAQIIQENRALSAKEQREKLDALATELEVYRDVQGKRREIDKLELEIRRKGRELERKDLDKFKEDITRAFSSAFEAAISGGKKFSEVLRSLEQDLMKIGTRFLILEPFERWLKGNMGGGGTGGGGGFLGGIFNWLTGGGGGGGGMGMSAAQIGSMGGAEMVSALPIAKGAAFNFGNIIPLAGGGVVSSPTLFQMTGGTGLMGEAGPEAVMPLTRGRDGKLGIASGGVGTTNISINISGITDGQGLRASADHVAVTAVRALERARARQM